ncbi:MAG: hypothetical protein IPM54_33140 [Polyangiaceae bacterium]|nr:hypothetical protein [Polyangiaceae bacterium]
MYRKNWITMLLAATVSMVVAVGCSDDGTTTPPPGSGGSAGAGGSGGSGGSGGAGGGMTGDSGKQSHAFVNAGHTVSGSGYKMVFTLGQSSPVQTNVSGSGYRMRGGLIGATSGK